MIPNAQEFVPILQNCERQGASCLFIESFNPEAQATASPESVACGSGLNKKMLTVYPESTTRWLREIRLQKPAASALPQKK